MNMTDEILNSWTDADECLADKIERIDENVNHINDSFTKAVQTNTAKAITLGLGQMGIICVQSATDSELYMFYTFADNPTVRVSKLASTKTLSTVTTENLNVTVTPNSGTWVFINVFYLSK